MTKNDTDRSEAYTRLVSMWQAATALWLAQHARWDDALVAMMEVAWEGRAPLDVVAHATGLVRLYARHAADGLLDAPGPLASEWEALLQQELGPGYPLPLCAARVILDSIRQGEHPQDAIAHGMTDWLDDEKRAESDEHPIVVGLGAFCMVGGEVAFLAGYDAIACLVQAQEDRRREALERKAARAEGYGLAEAAE